MIRQWLDALVAFLINSNLFIATGAFVMVWTTYLVSGYPVMIDRLSIFIFCATLLTYIMQRYLPARFGSNYEKEMKSWMFRHEGVVLLLSGIALAGMGVTAYQLPVDVLAVLAIMGVIALVYALPVIPWRGRWYRLRDAALLKPAFVGMVWAVATALVPLVWLGFTPLGSHGWMTVAERFLYIWGLTITFDIKDIDIDARFMHRKTLPQRAGVRKTVRLSIAVIALFCLVCLYHYCIALRMCHYFAAFAVSAAITAWLIWRVKASTPDRYYLFILDGMIILQFLLAWIAFKRWLF